MSFRPDEPPSPECAGTPAELDELAEIMASEFATSVRRGGRDPEKWSTGDDVSADRRRRIGASVVASLILGITATVCATITGSLHHCLPPAVVAAAFVASSIRLLLLQRATSQRLRWWEEFAARHEARTIHERIGVLRWFREFWCGRAPRVALASGEARLVLTFVSPGGWPCLLSVAIERPRLRLYVAANPVDFRSRDALADAHAEASRAGLLFVAALDGICVVAPHPRMPAARAEFGFRLDSVVDWTLSAILDTHLRPG